ncbi:hypothetical protein O7627_17580 [Solwaraspora sp. WMMD1047]|uniref:hypothetical protein n=1 Tax=Solwaraspora sp. WMMD1047 TaxID=3016102 RepID=UPI002417FEB1|nr:hypothetical protein [Solwaraspora sp. WMMD1047]MDG4831108.1 hypothetical protein [Solwaraspora sp. WMMD1047]
MTAAAGPGADRSTPFPVRVGDLIRIPESEYCYGVGELLMRITVVPASAHVPGLEWVELAGVPIGHRGREGDPRSALVRASALRRPGRVIRLPRPGS